MAAPPLTSKLTSSGCDERPYENGRLYLFSQSFAFCTLAHFQWSVMPNGGLKVYSATSPSVMTTTFSCRHFRLVRKPSPPAPITLESLSPSPTIDVSTTPFTISEVILSRAIELEAQLRSESPFTLRPRLRNDWFAEVLPDTPVMRSYLDAAGATEVIPDTTRLPACRLIPATYGPTEDPKKINILINDVCSKRLNELRWLFATIEGVETAMLYTRLVEQRDTRSFHLLTSHVSSLSPSSSSESFSDSTAASAPSAPHLSSETLHTSPASRLRDPWDSAWQILRSRPDHRAEVQAAYLAAVGLTWAPVPEMMEASWIYSLGCYGSKRISPYGSVELSRTSAPTVGSNSNPMVDRALRKGFVGFLEDVVAFWRGLSLPLDRHASLAPNADLSYLGALELRKTASRCCGDAWITGEVPVATLVKGAWETVDLQRTPSVQCEYNDMTVVLPKQLITVEFAGADGHAKEVVTEKMFVNGYSVIPNKVMDERFRVGVSGAGLFLGNNLFMADIGDRNGRQKGTWIFDVDRDFNVGGHDLGILFFAAHGANLRASYVESFARMFYGQFPFGAVAEWPRSCFFRADPTRQHQIVFEVEDVADRRGRAIYEMLRALKKYGGMLHLNCGSCHGELAPSKEMNHIIMRMAGMPRPRPRVSNHNWGYCLGRIHCDQLPPGRYTAEDLPVLPAASPNASSIVTNEIHKICFCKTFLQGNEEIEVRGRDRNNQPQGLCETDADPIVIEDGTTYTVSDLGTVGRSSGSGSGGSPRAYKQLPS